MDKLKREWIVLDLQHPLHCMHKSSSSYSSINPNMCCVCVGRAFYELLPSMTSSFVFYVSLASKEKSGCFNWMVMLFSSTSLISFAAQFKNHVATWVIVATTHSLRKALEYVVWTWNRSFYVFLYQYVYWCFEIDLSMLVVHAILNFRFDCVGLICLQLYCLMLN